MARTAKSAPSARANADTKARPKARKAAAKAAPKTPARSTRAANDDSHSGKAAAKKSGARGGGSRVLWKGAITFGLVLVPVELHTAARRQGLELDMLDKRSMDPIGYKRINKTTGKEVAFEDIVKGYAVEKGQYVVLGDADFKAANPKATQSVEIFSFIDREQIPPMYFDAPYYLVPQRSGVKVYALLMQAMQKENCVAIANVVIATKQHLAAVIPDGEKLMLNTLRYPDEIRDTGNLNMPDVSGASIKPAEMNMAQKLIESMRGDWNPEEYHDTYHEDIMTRIHEKADAGEINQVSAPEKTRAPAQRSAEVIDLMSLLQKSIPGAKSGAKAAAKPRASKTVATKATRKRAA
ncbi:MAG: Ku protein [Betaproteobacteria bacterium]|nr:Ku protein [Betaproteobacteria bacterium]